MSFTQAELDAMRAADAEIEADFCMTPEEIASARRRDEWAVFERVCMVKPPKDRESGLRRFKSKKKRVYTPEQLRRQRENNKKWREAHKEYRRDYCREWYQGRRALILAKQKAYHEANRGKGWRMGEATEKPTAKSSGRRKRRVTAASAKRRKEAVRLPRARLLRPMPPDFPAVAPTMRHEDLMARYRAGRGVVRRWLDECGFRRRSEPEPPPEGFAQIAPLHTQAELRRMYGRSGGVIDRWAREAGVKLKRIRRQCVRRDQKAEINMCLNCKKLHCNGECNKITGF